jgi:hypothetical protein
MNIYFQDKLYVIKIKMNLFQKFKNFATFFLMTSYFFSHLIKFHFYNVLSVFFFIAQNRQDFFSIFKTRVYREYNNVIFIINENKSERINKNNLENVYHFLLNKFSNE